MGGQGSLTVVGHPPPAPHPPLFWAVSRTPQIPQWARERCRASAGPLRGTGAQAGTEEGGPLGSVQA